MIVERITKKTVTLKAERGEVVERNQNGWSIDRVILRFNGDEKLRTALEESFSLKGRLRKIMRDVHEDEDKSQEIYLLIQKNNSRLSALINQALTSLPRYRVCRTWTGNNY